MGEANFFHGVSRVVFASLLYFVSLGVWLSVCDPPKSILFRASLIAVGGGIIWSPAWLERIMQGQWNATLSSLIVAYEVKWRCSPGCRASSNRSRCRIGIGTAPTAGAAQSIPSENSQRGVHLHCVVQSLHYCLPGTVYHLPAGNLNTRARTLQPRARLHCPGVYWLSLALCRVRTT